MKKYIIGFTAAILVCALAVGALAATGKLTIEVNTDMKIQVNGNVFAPTDVNGNPVPIFEYNGTTYAPLRALAEAYGLEVGYDAASRMATVSEGVPNVEPTPSVEPTLVVDYSDWDAEKEAAYQEFKNLWEIRQTLSTDKYYNSNGDIIEDKPFKRYRCDGEMTVDEALLQIDSANNQGFISRLLKELSNSECVVTIYFYAQNYSYFGATYTIH